MLDQQRYLVKSKSKLMGFGKKQIDILDESGGQVGSAKQKSGLMGMIVSASGRSHRAPMRIEVMDAAGKVMFTIRRKGLVFPKVEVIDAAGQIVGRFKKKMLSLTEGFHLVDKAGAKWANVKGKFFKKEFTFTSADGERQMGSVSKNWEGMAREMFTDSTSYGVTISDQYMDNQDAKIMILATAIAIDDILAKKKGGSKSKGKDADDEE